MNYLIILLILVLILFYFYQKDEHFDQSATSKLFMINTVNPPVVSFLGEGIAQFNDESSTSNAFNVGASTNFGVNASASSTSDYNVDGNALLSLRYSPQLQQTIGTSSSAGASNTDTTTSPTSPPLINSNNDFQFQQPIGTGSSTASYTDSTTSPTSPPLINSNNDFQFQQTIGTGSSTASYTDSTASSTPASPPDNVSTVTVNGIGSIAPLNTSDTSKFNVDEATRLSSSTSTATGNAANKSNLASSSFANQSNTESAKAFMQAFGGSGSNTEKIPLKT
jgi:hypothetical protein